LRLSCLSCGPAFGNVGEGGHHGIIPACRGKMMVVAFNSYYLLASSHYPPELQAKSKTR
jgi:hypothetical protein